MTIPRPYSNIDRFLEAQQREKAAKTSTQVDVIASALTEVREVLDTLSGNVAMLTAEIQKMAAMQQKQVEELQRHRSNLKVG